MCTRRTLLRSTTTTAMLAGLAGCQERASTGRAEQTGTDSAETTSDGAAGEGNGAATEYGPELAAAGQLLTYHARLADAIALGFADRHGLGSTVANEVFEAFEHAGGEYGAHEVLEDADRDAYEGFEHAAVQVRQTLAQGDHHAAASALDDAHSALRTATVELLGKPAADSLGILGFGSHAATAAVFAVIDEPRVSAAIANVLLSDIGDAAAFNALEDAASAMASEFQEAVRGILRAGQQDRSDAIRIQVEKTLDLATDGARTLAETPGDVAALASIQSQIHDAHLLARLGGPGRGYAHAATLTAYRARIHDILRLVEAGATDAAATAAISVLQHFEVSRAHEPLEESDHDAYEAFEQGVASLEEDATAGDIDACKERIATTDAALRTGIEALAPTNAAVLEAGFLRVRLADAQERFLAGDHEAAGTIASNVFERFERDELGVHEALEHQSRELYERFEHDHLGPLPDAFRTGNRDAAATHVDGVRGALLEFEANAGGAALSSGAEAAVSIGRAFDAAASASIGESDRAVAIINHAFETFEAGAGGFHEALEHADHETYETYEEHFTGIRSAAENGDDVFTTAKTFADTALDASYAIVDGAGGELGPVAAALARDTRARYRNAPSTSALAEHDSDVAESLDDALGDLETALAAGTEIAGSVATATRECQRAQFALVDALDAVPPADAGSKAADGSSFSGGPNVVEGVPEDADHVVGMTATTYEPAELTVAPGDTVAFEFTGGEPHTVTAYGDEIPDGAPYWASGGFESQAAAVEGWSNGEGAILEGESYVHEFTTPGEHHYYCIPHEALGMKGVVVVAE